MAVVISQGFRVTDALAEAGVSHGAENVPVIINGADMRVGEHDNVLAFCFSTTNVLVDKTPIGDGSIDVGPGLRVENLPNLLAGRYRLHGKITWNSAVMLTVEEVTPLAVPEQV